MISHVKLALAYLECDHDTINRKTYLQQRSFDSKLIMTRGVFLFTVLIVFFKREKPNLKDIFGMRFAQTKPVRA